MASTGKRIVLVPTIMEIMAYGVTGRLSHLSRVSIGFASGGGGGGGGGGSSLLVYFFGFLSLSSTMLGSNGINPDFSQVERMFDSVFALSRALRIHSIYSR